MPVRGSRVVAAMRYDSAARRISVRGFDGKFWEFDRCDEGDWDSFRSSSSKGEHLQNVLSRKEQVMPTVHGTRRPLYDPALRAVALNAFQPAHEIVDPHRFAGRRKEVRELLDAVRTDGSVPVIYGDRGLGKSSIAAQIQLMAMGDETLLEALDLLGYGLSDGETYVSVFISCTDAIRETQDVLHAVSEGLQSLEASSVEKDKFEIVEKTRRAKAGLKIFEVETSHRLKSSSGDAQLLGGEAVRQVADRVSGALNSRILVVLDELDRVSDTSGLASELRKLSTPRLKFILVGIADDWVRLLEDHQSLERHVMPVRIPAMGHGELAQIVDLAAGHLARNGLDVRIHSDARKSLVDLAAGYPWFVHVIGRAALMEAISREASVVAQDDVVRGLRDLVSNTFAQQFSAQYRRAVDGSVARELILRLCANHPERRISLETVYQEARESGVAAPQRALSQLLDIQYGGHLAKEGRGANADVWFVSEMFKRYVYLLPHASVGGGDGPVRWVRS